jgi:hypothetical protein
VETDALNGNSGKTNHRFPTVPTALGKLAKNGEFPTVPTATAAANKIQTMRDQIDKSDRSLTLKIVALPN